MSHCMPSKSADLKDSAFFIFIFISGLIIFFPFFANAQKNSSLNLTFTLTDLVSSKEVQVQPILKLTFSGLEKKILVADVKSESVSLKCEVSGQFSRSLYKKENYLASQLTFECEQDGVKEKTQVRQFFIPINDFSKFGKTIYLQKTYPKLHLKIQDLSF